MSRQIKKISIFYTLIFLLSTCAILVFYISNIIYVNNIAYTNNLLKDELKKSQQTNDLLKSDIEKLSSFEKIRDEANQKFGLALRDQKNAESDNIIVNRSEEF
ncbi:hypothetical protein BH10BAC5_BH10BAC5_17960 [soil metagenome]